MPSIRHPAIDERYVRFLLPCTESGLSANHPVGPIGAGEADTRTRSIRIRPCRAILSLILGIPEADPGLAYPVSPSMKLLDI